MEDVTTRKLPDDGDTVLVVLEANSTGRLIVDLRRGSHVGDG